MHIHFIPITQQNRQLALSLTVAKNQVGTVETVAQCLAEADTLPLWKPVILAINGTAVGFAMYGLWQNEGEAGRVWLDRFFIDHNHQGKGFAKDCLPPLITQIHKSYRYNRLYLSVYENNHPAIALYKRFGFTFTGEQDLNGELIMALDFTPAPYPAPQAL